MIPVTKSYFPPIAEYNKQIERIWQNQWLTNRGALVKELEEALETYLKTKHIIITNNGTVPLQIALKLLGNGGEIITTPFSYVATTAAIVWENCTPVFVDIHPEYLTIDETKIEAAITANTTAILATHVFGNPCHVEAIDAIAQKHNLKVIYDAAHCFGVEYKNQSIFHYGDISSCSFHATKLFHTAEGGAIFCKDDALHHQCFYSHNFGHNGPLHFHGLGINAKISELQAAMGLCVLNHIPEILAERKKIVALYTQHLSDSSIQLMTIRPDTRWNYSYFPVILPSEDILVKTVDQLNAAGIFPRRYFYPSLNTIEYAGNQKMPISENIASRILCLPLYVGLEEDIILQIITILKEHC